MRYDLDEITIVGNNLIINGVAEKDDGDFICEVETKELSMSKSEYNSLKDGKYENIFCYCSKLVITDLTDVTVQDKNNPKWITHKVIVLQSPKIVTSHSQANLTVIKGEVVGSRAEIMVQRKFSKTLRLRTSDL